MASLPHTADAHFRLCFFGAVLLLCELAGDPAAAPEPYLDELRAMAPAAGGSGPPDRREWDRQLARWEMTGSGDLPLCRLRTALDLHRLDLALLFLCGLAEEDPRFGRPTAGWLSAGFTDPHERARARHGVARLVAAGLVHRGGAESALHVDPVFWDALAGAAPAALTRPLELPRLEDLVLAPSVRARLEALVDAVEPGTGGVIGLRGPEGSGRTTVLRAIARALGLGTLDVATAGGGGAGLPDLSSTGALATFLGAMPVLDATSDDGVTRGARSGVPVHGGVLGMRLPPGVRVDGEVLAVVDLGVPDADERLAHWSAALPGRDPRELRGLAEAHRLSGGTIRRVARMAASEAAARSSRVIGPADVSAALRSLRPEPMGELATRVPARGDWSDLVVPEAVATELRVLE